MIPARVVGLEQARERWGARADEVARLYACADDGRPVSAPAWLDVARCNRGGAVLRRHGLLTALVLRCYALPLSYRSPVGVLPLIRTGNLLHSAGPRLYRTAGFVWGTAAWNALEEEGPGWTSALHVRAMHARVRQRLRTEGWDEAALGAPMPQPDVAATALLFGPMTVVGLRRLGVPVDADEADDVAHLARAIAYGQGVPECLQADTHDAAVDLFELLTAMHGPCSDDGRMLMRALLAVPWTMASDGVDRAMAPVLQGLYVRTARFLLGSADADALGVGGRGRLDEVFGKTHTLLPPVWRTSLQDRLVDAVLERGKRSAAG